MVFLVLEVSKVIKGKEVLQVSWVKRENEETKG